MTLGVFDVGAFERRRAARGATLGAPITALLETESTNDLALAAAASGAPHGAVFVADTQTKGRGRRGHTWNSPPGENLTASLVLRPDVPAERVASVTLVVGLAVRAAVAERIPTPVSVKWPNDVVAGGRKLAGILVESRLVGSRVDAVVVGIGLNVHMRALPAEILDVATSLALLGDPAPSREAVFADVLAELGDRLAVFGEQGLAPLVDELREHDALLGERIAVGDVEGTAAGIDADGALFVRTDAGLATRVTSGTVVRR